MLLKHYIPDETILNGILQTGNRKLFSVSSSNYTIFHGPENALNDEESYFHSDYPSEMNPWYKIEFKDLFYIQSYAFKTRHIQDDYFPQQWELKGSLDDEIYVPIDRQNVTDLNINNKTQIFQVNTSNIFKYFIFENIKSTEGIPIFVVRSIDLFGYFVNQKLLSGIPTCKMSMVTNYKALLFLFYMSS